MKRLEKPLEFESEVIEETEECYILSIPQHIQEQIPKSAKYIYISILDFKGHP